MPDRYTYLAGVNPLPRDARIRYEDEEHLYFLDGVQLPLSVSGFIKQYFPEFDADECLDKYFDKWASSSTAKYSALINYLRPAMPLSEVRQEIKKMWTAAGQEASSLGTAMHNNIEAHNNKATVQTDSVEFKQYVEWEKSFLFDLELEMFRTELSIFDEDGLFAGQIDALYRSKLEPDIYVMVDWKRCNPVPRENETGLDVLDKYLRLVRGASEEERRAVVGEQPTRAPIAKFDLLGPKQRAFAGETGRGPCSTLPNTSFWHYVLQQRMYASVLERLYGIRVSSCWLVQLHPALPKAHCVQVPCIDTTIDEVLTYRYEEVMIWKAENGLLS